MKKIHYFLLAASLGVVALITGTLVNSVEEYTPRSANGLGELPVKGDGQVIGPALEHIYSLKNNQITGTYSAEDVEKALAQADALLSTRRITSPFNWVSEGPDNIGGRTRAFLIDKDDPNLMFAGGVSGGLFRSTTGGASWTTINDFQQELFVVSITQDKNGNIYYGVGESIFPGGTTFAARGIYKSDNREGTSFTKLTGTSAGWSNVASLASNMSTGRIFAGSSSGFFYSDDEGKTWTRPGNGTGTCRDIKVASDGTVFAFLGSQIRRSTDGAAAFETLTVPTSEGYLGSIGRIEMAIAHNDPNYVYAVVATAAGNLNGIYGTTDKGDNWSLLASGGSPFTDALSQVNTLDGQGIYDLTISVDPKDKNHIYYGGVQMGEYHPNYGLRIVASTTDLPTNSAYVHADKHLIEWDMSKTPPTMIVGTDGGFYFSYDNGVSFQKKNFGFTTTQFYGIAASSNGRVFGGTQDNGCIQITHNGNAGSNGISRNGERLLSGDGFQTEYSFYNENSMVGESQYGNVLRSDDGGKTFECFWDTRIGSTADEVCDRVTTSSSWAPFNTELALYEWDSMVHLIDTSYVDVDTVINGRDTVIKKEVIFERDSNLNISRLFYSKNNEVWMCNGVFDFIENPAWFKIASGFSGSPADLEISADGDVLFMVTTSNVLYRIEGLRNANYDPNVSVVPKTAIPAGITIQSISAVSTGLPGGGRDMTSVTINPEDPNHLLITYANYGNTSYIYESFDGLSATPTFTNITNNFPSMPVYDGCLVTINNKLHYVLGTEFGVWASDDGGATWQEENDGLARVPVYHVRAYHWQDWKKPSIFVGSHGRGIYSHNSPFHVDYTGIDDIVKNKNSNGKKKEALKLYPNPAINFSVVEFNSNGGEEVNIVVYDIKGQIVLTQKVLKSYEGVNKVRIHTSSLEAGNYFIRVTGKSTKGFSKLVVIK